MRVTKWTKASEKSNKKEWKPKETKKHQLSLISAFYLPQKKRERIFFQKILVRSMFEIAFKGDGRRLSAAVKKTKSKKPFFSLVYFTLFLTVFSKTAEHKFVLGIAVNISSLPLISSFFKRVQKAFSTLLLSLSLSLSLSLFLSPSDFLSLEWKFHVATTAK